MDIRKTFKVQVGEEEFDGGYVTYNRRDSSSVVCRHTSLYCAKCDEIWARIRWDVATDNFTSLSHVPCEKHGTGLIVPLLVTGVKELVFPVEVLRRDFLIMMEKKIGWEPGYTVEVASGFPTDLNFGSHMLPFFETDYGWM